MHFKPADGYVGDVIPFYWSAEYHAFYLKRQEGHSLIWAHAVSADLVQWRDLPIAIDVGGPDDPDAKGCWTGSVIESEGTFHIFYTGHNSGKKYPPQTICHATSPDLIHWEKDLSNPIMLPDPTWYENDDWRNPFVFWNEEEKCYWMLITARLEGQLTPRRGCIAVAKSRNLKDWRVHPSLWTPHLVYAPECPDLFRIGKRWYLIFSNVETRYRAATSLEGPWLRFPVESFDNQRFYAAKTVSNGKRRFLLGWIPSQEGERDEGRWEWGGHMALPREIVQQPDGSLAVRCPEEIVKAFREPVAKPGLPTEYEIGAGSWSMENRDLIGTRKDGFAFLKFAETPDDYFLEATLRLSSFTTSAGFVFRMSSGLESGYSLALEPFAHRVAFRYWRAWGDPQPHVERPLDIKRGQPVNCRIVVQGTILEAFFNYQVAMSARVYNNRKGQLCFFVQDGQAHFGNACLTKIP